MAGYAYLLGLAAIVSFCAVNSEARPEGTWDTIKKGVKQGFDVAYDGVHCGFHKVKELVKHHEHEEGRDPCEGKPPPAQPPASSTTPEAVTIADSLSDLGIGRPSSTPPPIGWQGDQPRR